MFISEFRELMGVHGVDVIRAAPVEAKAPSKESDLSRHDVKEVSTKASGERKISAASHVRGVR